MGVITQWIVHKKLALIPMRSDFSEIKDLIFEIIDSIFGLLYLQECNFLLHPELLSMIFVHQIIADQ